MSFEVKMFILLETKIKADKQGPKGEMECTVWDDSDMTIDFGRITRLEKITAEHFKHIHADYTGFRRAGIVVVDLFLHNLFLDLEVNVGTRFSPEILIPRSVIPEMSPQPTVKVGGKVYVDCGEHRLKTILDDDNFISMHNQAVGGSATETVSYLKLNKWTILDPPFFWTSCAHLAYWLDQAEKGSIPGWNALRQDRVAMAIAWG